MIIIGNFLNLPFCTIKLLNLVGDRGESVYLFDYK